MPGLIPLLLTYATFSHRAAEWSMLAIPDMHPAQLCSGACPPGRNQAQLRRPAPCGPPPRDLQVPTNPTFFGRRLFTRDR